MYTARIVLGHTQVRTNIFACMDVHAAGAPGLMYWWVGVGLGVGVRVRVRVQMWMWGRHHHMRPSYTCMLSCTDPRAPGAPYPRDHHMRPCHRVVRVHRGPQDDLHAPCNEGGIRRHLVAQLPACMSAETCPHQQEGTLASLQPFVNPRRPCIEQM